MQQREAMIDRVIQKAMSRLWRWRQIIGQQFDSKMIFGKNFHIVEESIKLSNKNS